MLLAAIGIRAITDRELIAGLASPSGGGELWTAAWRWWEHRPRVSLGFAAPAPFGGVWGVDGFDERQTYANAGSTIEEARRRAGFHVGDWTRAGFRWEAGVAVDRWREAGRAVSLTLSGQQRLDGDRGTSRGEPACGRGGVRAWTLGLRTEWRSQVRHEGTVWIGRAGVEAAADRSPLAFWPGAGTGQGRDVLLRAHPLLDDGIIATGCSAAGSAHGGSSGADGCSRRANRFVSLRRCSWMSRVRPPVWSRPTGAGTPTWAQGIRIAVPGAGVAADRSRTRPARRAMALSVGWSGSAGAKRSGQLPAKRSHKLFGDRQRSQELDRGDAGVREHDPAVRVGPLLGDVVCGTPQRFAQRISEREP